MCTCNGCLDPCETRTVIGNIALRLLLYRETQNAYQGVSTDNQRSRFTGSVRGPELSSDARIFGEQGKEILCRHLAFFSLMCEIVGRDARPILQQHLSRLGIRVQLDVDTGRLPLRLSTVQKASSLLRMVVFFVYFAPARQDRSFDATVGQTLIVPDEPQDIQVKTQPLSRLEV